MPRIYITVSDDLASLIADYQKREGYKSQAQAAAELAAIGAGAVFGREVAAVAAWGDVSRIHRMSEWMQCPQCGDWNVGKDADGNRGCSHCGWSSADE